MTLKGMSRKRLNLLLLSFVLITGFGLLFVTRFNATNINPANKAVQNTSQKNQTDVLQPSDKTELPQTDTMELKSAEQAMPQQGTAGYATACQNLKQMYIEEHSAKLRAEAGRFAASQQEIINKYNQAGKSFSLGEKSAHYREKIRNDRTVKEINAQLTKQLETLGCN